MFNTNNEQSTRLYVFGGRGRTRTDADGRGRTRTDADIYLFFDFKKKIYIFFCIHRSTGPIGARPWVRPLGSPPPTHHDPIKIHIVYRWSPLFILFLTLRCILCIPGGGGGYSLYFSYAYVPPECPSFWRFFSRWQPKNFPFTLNMPYKFSS